jgi:hypothetical protein
MIVYVYRIDHRNNEIADRFEQSLKRVGSKRSESLLALIGLFGPTSTV